VARADKFGVAVQYGKAGTAHHPQVPDALVQDTMTASRILVVPDYHGSGEISRRHMASLTGVLPPDVELVFVEARSIFRHPLGWWHDDIPGWERARDWVLGLVAREHFDGVIGFSQGAALIGLLTGLQQSDPTTSLRFGFAIMVGGFTGYEPDHAALFERKIAIPSLHVMGETDGIVSTRDSLRLAEWFEHPVIVKHPGGHVTPSDPTSTLRIAKFIAERA
jgi:predicted esterase